MKNSEVVHVAVISYHVPGDYHGPSKLFYNTKKLYSNKEELMKDVAEYLEAYPIKGKAVIDKDDWLSDKTLCGTFTVKDVPEENNDTNNWKPYERYSYNEHQSYYVTVTTALYVEQIDMVFQLKEFMIDDV